MLDAIALATEPDQRDAMTPLQRVAAICPGYLEAAAAARRAERERMARDQVARARRVGQDSGVAGKRDLGPAIRVERRDIVPEFREDPDPAIGALLRGSHARDPLRKMFRAGDISKAHWNGACRLRDDIDFSAGVEITAQERCPIRVPVGGAKWPGDLQVQAVCRVRFLWAELGPKLSPIIAWMVVHRGSLGHFALTHRTRKTDLADQLRVGLHIVAVFYEGRP